MADITKCNGTNCPQKSSCFRYTAEDSRWQSYANFDANLTYGKPCNDYYEDTRKNKNGNYSMEIG